MHDASRRERLRGTTDRSPWATSVVVALLVSRGVHDEDEDDIDSDTVDDEDEDDTDTDDDDVDDDDDLPEVKSERERDVCDSSSMPRHVLLTVPTMCTAKPGADNERSHVDVSLDVDVNRRRAPSTGARSAHDGARHERGGRRSSPCSK